MPNIKDFLESADPLTREAVLFLISYREEDDRVDYKQTFDPDSEKAWLAITKDISAFANTWGGYLVFGVTDVDREVVGIPGHVAEVLKDPSNLHQKLNRYLEPHIIALRSKEFRIEGKVIVVVLIPQSTGTTHLICKDGSFKHPSGKEKSVLRAGTFYVRRSASNHLADSRDLSDLIERRIDQFRDSLMDKVARVIRSPDSSEIFILSKDPSDRAGDRFIIEDSPESIPVKGMSFTVAPEGPEEEVAAWSVISRGTAESRPPPSVVWTWYAHRERLQLRELHKLAVFRFSLWDHVPPFFWIRGLRAQVIRETLLDALRNRPSNTQVSEMLVVASFLGKRTYTKALSVLGEYRGRLTPAQKNYSPPNPGDTHESTPRTSRKQAQAKAQIRKEQLKKLEDITSAAAKAGKEPPLAKRWTAHKIDRFLYAQTDQYKPGAT